MTGGRRRLGGETSTRGPLRAIATGVLDLLFPWSCVSCAAPGRALCDTCRGRIGWLPRSGCPRCGLPPGPGPCGPCLLAPPAFDRARAPAVYAAGAADSDPLGAALRALKYGRRRALAGPLGDLLAERLPYGAGEHDVVVAVPLHSTRLRERGFNQAVLLAGPVAARLGIPVVVDALGRSRATPPQASLDERDRRRNVRGAFVVRRPAAVHRRRVLLVDDVVTSGATADACAASLRVAGADAVDVVSLARALRSDAR